MSAEAQPQEEDVSLKENDDGTLTLESGDEPDDDGEGEGDEEPQLSRAERRRERGRIREENERLRAQLEEKSRREAEYERRLAAIEQGRQQQQPDRFDEEMKRLREEELRILNTQPATHEEARKLQERALELRDQQAYLRGQKASWEVAAQQQRQAPHPIEAALQAEYSDVYSNQRALAWATAAYTAELHETGGQFSKAGAEKFLGQARLKFSTSQNRHRPDADEATKSRFTGMARGGNGQSAPRPTTSITRTELGMATTMYPNLPPAQAAKLWLKNVKNKRKS